MAGQRGSQSCCQLYMARSWRSQCRRPCRLVVDVQSYSSLDFASQDLGTLRSPLTEFN